MDSIWQWLTDNFTGWTLQKVYLSCAVAGGTVLVLQTLLLVFGIGGGDADGIDADTDIDSVDHDGGGELNVLSVRAITGFVTFFGLVGWAGTAQRWPAPITAIAALAAGLCVMLMIAWIMRMFRRMTASGNVDPRLAVGRTATVYLRIPANSAGKGKVTVSLQGRSLEFLAMTKGDAIPTGHACRIVDLSGDDTFEVQPID